MKKYSRLFLLILITCVSFTTGSCQNAGSLKIVIIRHGEKPDDGDNLNCKGFNRSLALTTALYKKFGVVSAIYVPSINTGNSTKSGRMFQTITPYAVKYNLQINSSFDDNDYKKIAKEVFNRTGTVLLVWEHNSIGHLAKALGVKGDIRDWPDSDFDSIWIITYNNGKAVLSGDKEGLNPSSNCPF
jgi:hypothetical protein